MIEYSHLILLFLAIGVIAFLYSCVVHAGASGYIAVMTLFGLVITTIRPTALVLNILVAIIASFQFWRAGHSSWKLFWPFALLSVPAAYFGGYLQLPARILKIIIGLDRKSTRLNSSHLGISYAVFCLKKKNNKYILTII